MAEGVERARLTDLAGVEQLVLDSGLTAEGLADHLNTAFVVRAEGLIVGSAVLEIYSGGALLRSVAVAEQSRARGLGRELTAKALELAQELGVTDVFLLTLTAEEYFARLGFAEICREDVPDTVRASVQFLSACPSTATVMHRPLSDAA